MTNHTMRSLIVGAALVLVLNACSDSTPVFHESENPLRLSDWNLLAVSDNELAPLPTTLVVRPTNQLFTDYAHKLRTLWIPQGKQAHLIDGEIDYPVGTVLSKTFYYPIDDQQQAFKSIDQGSVNINLQRNTLLETRLLVRRDKGWDAFPYIWNDAQSEAFLRVAGGSHSMSLKTETGTTEFVYFVPNENQCAGCHVTEHPDGDMHPLGAIASQLNAPFENGTEQFDTQLAAMVARGWLDKILAEPATKSYLDESNTIEERALAYLDIHCGHCHNPEGAADTSALILDGSHDLLVNMGVCKPPVAAGGGAGDMQFGIVPGSPDRSILLYRMNSTEPDEMMPELGRSLIHSEGVELVSDWIEQMSGRCQ